jgi:hypothetical protein
MGGNGNWGFPGHCWHSVGRLALLSGHTGSEVKPQAAELGWYHGDVAASVRPESPGACRRTHTQSHHPNFDFQESGASGGSPCDMPAPTGGSESPCEQRARPDAPWTVSCHGARTSGSAGSESGLACHGPLAVTWPGAPLHRRVGPTPGACLPAAVARHNPRSSCSSRVSLVVPLRQTSSATIRIRGSRSWDCTSSVLAGY